MDKQQECNFKGIYASREKLQEKPKYSNLLKNLEQKQVFSWEKQYGENIQKMENGQHSGTLKV
ncbi:unnamed protein product (macronuclear) [Paramecium tetraurelia]|uniref:Uncharacterized protein n=1 Tax=Paramecium tetraurelia TaxID=5888 RepID=A0C712_PARTE|nr:uncharacterized protein GSPATT00035708001 [Paramecium tetraurelia]CAK66579.1 unnamed protein product [Paramecium tetraurelia]|eukprot:XP_001433976.1 hypothetical protein (macronuclear) [Paramecium tetraurelia strain d4-2]